MVWGLTDNRCVYCGDTPDTDEERTVDHIIPASRGGVRSLKNLLPACRECNARRGNQHLKYMQVCAEFRDMVMRAEDKMILAAEKKKKPRFYKKKKMEDE